MPLEEQENRGFGPVIKKRSETRITTWSCLMLFLFLLIVVIIIVLNSSDVMKSLQQHLQCIAISMVAVFLGEHLHRACLFMEELKHRHTRYEGSWKKVFMASFVYPATVRLCVYSFAVIFIFISAWSLTLNPQQIPASTWFCANAFLVSLWLHLTGFHSLAPCEVSSLSESQGNNVAEGLVWAQYFGYLKYILPNFVTQLKKSAEFRDKLALEKVLILIPKDCFVPQKLEAEDDRIEKVGITPELTLQLNGFPRIFKHTVYKIDTVDKGKIKPVYFVAEWPAILHRLHEMTEHAEAGLSRVERDIQVKLLYRRLEDILENHAPGCKNTFCLVPYGGRGRLADIILTAINDANKGPILT